MALGPKFVGGPPVLEGSDPPNRGVGYADLANHLLVHLLWMIAVAPRAGPPGIPVLK